ncbi:MAG TPA: GGDEF domain-containing protein [Nannocystis sp.]
MSQGSTDIDPLTGVWNRRRLLADLTEAFVQRRPATLVMFDLDNFKHFNLHNGHLTGDEVLRAVPRVIASVLGAGDVVYRYAGQRFAATMPGSDMRAAAARAEQIRAEIERTLAPPQLEHCGDRDCLGPVRPLTVSIAVVPPGGTVEETIALALETIHRAKLEGRNRVCLAAS